MPPCALLVAVPLYAFGPVTVTVTDSIALPASSVRDVGTE
jgi:hypothetical protein